MGLFQDIAEKQLEEKNIQIAEKINPVLGAVATASALATHQISDISKKDFQNFGSQLQSVYQKRIGKVVKAEQLQDEYGIAFIDEHGNKLIKKGGDISVLANNPGNICKPKDGFGPKNQSELKAMGAVGFFYGEEHVYAIFPDIKTGQYALRNWLNSPDRAGWSVNYTMHKFAPEKYNDTENYIRFLEQHGISRKARLRNLDTNQKEKMAQAITKMEGSKPVKSEEFIPYKFSFSDMIQKASINEATGIPTYEEDGTRYFYGYYCFTESELLNMLDTKFSRNDVRVAYEFNKHVYMFSDTITTIHYNIVFLAATETNLFDSIPEIKENKNADEDTVQELIKQYLYIAPFKIYRNDSQDSDEMFLKFLFNTVDNTSDYYDMACKINETKWVVCRSDEFGDVKQVPLFQGKEWITAEEYFSKYEQEDENFDELDESIEDINILVDEKNNNISLNLYLNNQKIGFLEATIDEDIIDIDYFEIISEYRNKGYGRTLVTKLIDLYKPKTIVADVLSKQSYKSLVSVLGEPDSFTYNNDNDNQENHFNNLPNTSDEWRESGQNKDINYMWFLDKQLNESIEDNDNTTMVDVEDIVSEITFSDVLNIFHNDDNPWYPLIEPISYKRALQEFTKTGKLLHTNTRDVESWFETIIRNTRILDLTTELSGHSQWFPFEEVKDYYFGDDEEAYNNFLKKNNIDSTASDYEIGSIILDKMGFYKKMVLPDGTDAISDYGLKPLWNIIYEYKEMMSAEELLVIINKALDVYHQRGDLASAFIKGGSSSLSQISNESKKILGKKLNESIKNTIIIDGIERPIYNSENNLISKDKQSIINFWKWFDDSKVVDEQGRPLVCYHGTDAEFDTFDKDKIRWQMNLTYGKGFYFTTRNNLSGRYGKNNMPCYIKLNKPLRTYDYYLGQSVIDSFIKQGFDGVLGLTSDDKVDEVVAFEPNQIKSVNNKGTFNPNSNNINEAFDDNLDITNSLQLYNYLIKLEAAGKIADKSRYAGDRFKDERLINVLKSIFEPELVDFYITHKKGILPDIGDISIDLFNLLDVVNHKEEKITDLGYIELDNIAKISPCGDPLEENYLMVNENYIVDKFKDLVDIFKISKKTLWNYFKINRRIKCYDRIDTIEESIKSNKVIAYHGSQTDKLQFAADHTFYLTDNYDLAYEFATKDGDGGLIEGEVATIYTCELNIKKAYETYSEEEYDSMFLDININRAHWLSKGYNAIIIHPTEGSPTTYYIMLNPQEDVKIIKKEVIGGTTDSDILVESVSAHKTIPAKMANAIDSIFKKDNCISKLESVGRNPRKKDEIASLYVSVTSNDEYKNVKYNCSLIYRSSTHIKERDRSDIDIFVPNETVFEKYLLPDNFTYKFDEKTITLYLRQGVFDIRTKLNNDRNKCKTAIDQIEEDYENNYRNLDSSGRYKKYGKIIYSDWFKNYIDKKEEPYKKAEEEKRRTEYDKINTSHNTLHLASFYSQR